MGNCKDNHDRGIRSAGMNKKRYREKRVVHTSNTQATRNCPPRATAKEKVWIGKKPRVSLSFENTQGHSSKSCLCEIAREKWSRARGGADRSPFKHQRIEGHSTPNTHSLSLNHLGYVRHETNLLSSINESEVILPRPFFHPDQGILFALENQL